MKHKALLLAMTTALVVALAGPRAAAEPPSPPAWPEAIEDNSFFMEEAYNQEKDVVQHISGLWHDGPSGRNSYGFTQEWPLRGPRHQLSYTLGYDWEDGGHHLGDLLLNYRYQLADKSAWAAVAPRLSLVWPRGDDGGRGRLGLQANLAASKRVSAGLAMHANLGETLERREARDFAGRTDLWTTNLGLSAVWLLRPKLNLMLETIMTVTSDAGPADEVVHRTEVMISPGLRRAWDRGSLQIVPGVAVPIRVSGPERGAGVFFYLSFEHPFRSGTGG